MPDLETAAVRAWLQEHETVALHVQDVSGAPSDESPEVLTGLRRCGVALDDTLAAKPETLARLLGSEPTQGELRQIMGQMGIGWALRMLRWISGEGLLGSDAIVAGLTAADSTGSGQFLQASLAEAARPVLLSRLFAPERLADLLAACTQASQTQEAA